jgi:D-alanine--poly(phosphoribitol) ligase subunit 1
LYGPNIAYGYLNDPENTYKSFILNNSKTFSRGYRTGDLVIKRKNNYLYFVGRQDSQIKHMGYRIELNELELLINKLKNVKEACVFYLKKINKDYGKIILLVSTLNKINKNNIIKYIKKNLPSYFMPSEILFCDSLKKNDNGKIDRTYIKKFYEKRISH